MSFRQCRVSRQWQRSNESGALSERKWRNMCLHSSINISQIRRKTTQWNSNCCRCPKTTKKMSQRTNGENSSPAFFYHRNGTWSKVDENKTTKLEIIEWNNCLFQFVRRDFEASDARCSSFSIELIWNRNLLIFGRDIFWFGALNSVKFMSF